MGISVIAYFLGVIKPFFKNILIIYAIVIGLFIISPLISQGLNAVRTYDVDDNFLDRASSIYDLSENSNL